MMSLMPFPIGLSPNDELPPAESRRVNPVVLRVSTLFFRNSR